ncbi:MAG TPA: cysteine dioxygenase family protein [Gammaproteobacteria bacterium]|nr:cysteine dioxygenase family protein [Gammaproteobacteria bacterium]
MAVSQTNASTAGFPGGARLVDALDGAMQRSGATAVTDAVKRVLSSLIGNGDFELPAICYRPSAEHYQRHELYRSERHGYSVVAMTWAPEQGTALHDHAGLWCVEGVCAGCIEVEQYEPVEREAPDRYRFERRQDHLARTGTAGSLIPPYEYHRISNTSASESAVSLHIYERTMTECHVFEPLGDGWFRRATRQLCFDD